MRSRPKTIEKTLPMLNEIGVDSIYFVYADRSQKNFKLDIERINRILVNSCCQCGRTSLMDISVFKNIKEFCASNKQFLVLDFGGEKPTLNLDMNNTLLIGPEGGFSESERELLKKTAKKIIAFGTQNILRSETAVVAAASLCII